MNPEEPKKLGDGRNELGDDFAAAQIPADRSLGASLSQPGSGQVETLGDEFADPALAERRKLGNSFSDPNSLDDQKLGNAFADANSTGKKRRREPTGDGKPKDHRILYWFLAGVVVLFLIIFLVGYLPRHARNQQNARKSEQEQNALPMIEVEQVKPAVSGTGLTIPGTTTPLTEAFVYARSNGYLKKRLVDIGDHVHKGQLLAVIDSPDLDQQVDQAREQLRQAEAQLVQQQTQLALARITVERYRALVAKGVFSRQDGDQREADFRAQEANVAAAVRNVEAFKANLGRNIALQQYERVTAPFTGIITARNVDLGALISAQGTAGGAGAAPQPGSGSTTQTGTTNTSGTSGNAPTAATPSNAGAQGGALFSIAQVDRLRILISVPEGYASSIRTGQPASLHFQEFPTGDFFGNVTRTSASIDQNTRTLLTEVQVDNHAGKLMSGMYAVVTFAGTKGQGPITIPGDAVAVRNDRSVVAVVQNDKIKIQPIDLGRDYGPAIEVLNGLKVGDLIATSFTDEVRDGVKVQTKTSKTAGENTSPTPPSQNAPPGGSTQYGNQAITDANMQGQASAQGKGKGAGTKKAAGSESKQ